MTRERAFCLACGIASGNSAGIRVRRWPLIAGVTIDGRKTSRCIGSAGLCDDCIQRGAKLNDWAERILPARRARA